MSKEIQSLVTRLRPLIDQPGTGDMCSLLRLYTEQWKEELVEAKVEDVPKLQGAITKVKAILADLRRDIKLQEYRNGAYNGEG